MRKHLNLQTHDGIFHADDVFATALLSLMTEDMTVIRSHTAPADPENWIIYDVLDGELDHHSPECKERNGTHPGTNVPYASCGLVWDRYYKEILEAIDCPEEYYNGVHDKFEKSMILGIDAQDNGYNAVNEVLETLPNIALDKKQELKAAAAIPFAVSDIIRDFNPTWDSDASYYDSFLDAVSFAKDIVLNRLDSIISALDARGYVLNHIAYSANHVMIMETFAPWESILYSQSYRDPKAKDIWYVLTPSMRDGWNIQCALSDSHDRTSFRHPFPKEWWGLRDEELQSVSGIQTARFCHASGFLATVETESDAIALASKAMKR